MLIATLSYSKLEGIQLQREESAWPFSTLFGFWSILWKPLGLIN